MKQGVTKFKVKKGLKGKFSVFALYILLGSVGGIRDSTGKTKNTATSNFKISGKEPVKTTAIFKRNSKEPPTELYMPFTPKDDPRKRMGDPGTSIETTSKESISRTKEIIAETTETMNYVSGMAETFSKRNSINTFAQTTTENSTMSTTENHRTTGVAKELTDTKMYIASSILETASKQSVAKRKEHVAETTEMMEYSSGMAETLNEQDFLSTFAKATTEINTMSTTNIPRTTGVAKGTEHALLFSTSSGIFQIPMHGSKDSVEKIPGDIVAFDYDPISKQVFYHKYDQYGNHLIKSYVNGTDQQILFTGKSSFLLDVDWLERKLFAAVFEGNIKKFNLQNLREYGSISAQGNILCVSLDISHSVIYWIYQIPGLSGITRSNYNGENREAIFPKWDVGRYILATFIVDYQHDDMYFRLINNLGSYIYKMKSDGAYGKFIVKNEGYISAMVTHGTI